jgi:hypothetical protein
MYPNIVTLKHHRFDLTAMSVGDWFLGCNRCGFQLEAFTAAWPTCPECGSGLKISQVTEADVPTGEIPCPTSPSAPTHPAHNASTAGAGKTQHRPISPMLGLNSDQPSMG